MVRECKKKLLFLPVYQPVKCYFFLDAVDRVRTISAEITSPARGGNADSGTRGVNEVSDAGGSVLSGEVSVRTGTVSMGVVWGASVIVRVVAVVFGDSTVNARVSVVDIDGLLTMTMYCPGGKSTRNP
jgi:hypothetical protein